MDGPISGWPGLPSSLAMTRRLPSCWIKPKQRTLQATIGSTSTSRELTSSWTLVALSRQPGLLYVSNELLVGSFVRDHCTTQCTSTFAATSVGGGDRLQS